MIDYLLTDYWSANGDPRVVHMPLMSSFKPVTLLLLSYAAFVLWIGPRWMANRKAFTLKLPMLCYNVFMSLFNLYFFLSVLYRHNWGMDMFEMKFPSFDKENSTKVQAVINLHHLYMISKLIDLLDTIFFVLRKKQSQVTWLHFYHHFSVPIQAWTYVRLCGNSAIVIPFGMLNSFIHTVMYAYYGLSSLGPSVQPYLWWKRYLTQLQIVQFVAIFTYAVYFINYQQGYPRYFTYNLLVQTCLYIVLFTRFYMQTYKRVPQKSVQQKAIDTNNNCDNNNTSKIKSN